MITVILIISCILLALILILGIVWLIRTRHFRPNPDKAQQQNALNNDLKDSGFAYHLMDDYFYSRMDCWQREVGYCRLYDEGALFFNMIFDAEPITFSYGGKRWLIELWKGQYGITTGAEIGIYNTTLEDLDTDRFRGTFYENIQDSEFLPLSFVLRRKGRVLLRREATHWWLTAFKLGTFSKLRTLTMDASISFPDAKMCAAFVGGLIETGYRRREYKVRGNRVDIRFTKPHSDQPASRNKLQAGIVQKVNKSNCRLYKKATARYSDTLDKLEYLKNAMPEVYELFVKSLYAKGVYAAFDWIRDIIYPHHPVPPVPPKPPYPPVPPCPPKPPCPPTPPCPPKPPCPPMPTCPLEPTCPPVSACLPLLGCPPKPSRPAMPSCPAVSSFPDTSSCPTRPVNSLEQDYSAESRCGRSHSDLCHSGDQAFHYASEYAHEDHVREILMTGPQDAEKTDIE